MFRNSNNYTETVCLSSIKIIGRQRKWAIKKVYP